MTSPAHALTNTGPMKAADRLGGNGRSHGGQLDRLFVLLLTALYRRPWRQAGIVIAPIYVSASLGCRGRNHTPSAVAPRSKHRRVFFAWLKEPPPPNSPSSSRQKTTTKTQQQQKTKTTKPKKDNRKTKQTTKTKQQQNLTRRNDRVQKRPWSCFCIGGCIFCLTGVLGSLSLSLSLSHTHTHCGTI